MPAPMSMDLRRRIVRAVEAGSSIRAAPARFGGHRRPLLAPHEGELRRLVTATPDLTLVELQAALERRVGLRAGLSTIHKAVRRIGLRLKKSR